MLTLGEKLTNFQFEGLPQIGYLLSLTRKLKKKCQQRFLTFREVRFSKKSCLGLRYSAFVTSLSADCC